jgi:virulence factor Mce-like protein
MTHQSRGARAKSLIAFLGVGTLATVFVLWLLTLGGGLPALSSTHYGVSAVLPDGGAQLVPGARVTMAGVQVGTVDAISHRGDDAVVRMTIDDHAVTPLPADSRAELRTRTPLGENYIEILVGRSHAMLAPGGVLSVKQAVGTVEVDQVLSVLSGRDETQARRLIQGLGGAVAGRGAELNALIGSGSSATRNGSPDVDALAAQRGQISGLVSQLGDLTSGIGSEGAEIRELAGAGLDTFTAIAARDVALRRLIDVMPRTLGAVKTTTGTLGRVTGDATPVLFDLATTLRAARPTARLLAPASTQLHDVLADLKTAAPPLRTTLTQLRAVAPEATTVLPEAHKLLCQLNPVIRYAKPYTSDILALFTEFGSAANPFDAIGHTFMMEPTINTDAYVGQDATTAAALQTVLETGLLSTTDHVTYDPFPGPGQANAVSTGKTEVTGPSTVRAQSGYVYPHIVADC